MELGRVGAVALAAAIGFAIHHFAAAPLMMTSARATYTPGQRVQVANGVILDVEQNSTLTRLGENEIKLEQGPGAS